MESHTPETGPAVAITRRCTRSLKSVISLVNDKKMKEAIGLLKGMQDDGRCLVKIIETLIPHHERVQEDVVIKVDAIQRMKGNICIEKHMHENELKEKQAKFESKRCQLNDACELLLCTAL